MTSMQILAPRDQVRRFVVRVEAEVDGAVQKIQVPVEYYRNRISLAPLDALVSDEDAKDMSDAEYDAVRAASTLCHYLKSWDVQGPLYDSQGEEVVAAGEDIPLDPRIVQYVPTLVVGEVMRQLTEEVFPNSRPSRNERRRSR
jgi:hypothetical protein